jgi:hypothetical protein
MFLWLPESLADRLRPKCGVYAKGVFSSSPPIQVLANGRSPVSGKQKAHIRLERGSWHEQR